MFGADGLSEAGGAVPVVGITGALTYLLFRTLWRQDSSWQGIVKAAREDAAAARLEASEANERAQRADLRALEAERRQAEAEREHAVLRERLAHVEEELAQAMRRLGLTGA